MPICEQLIEHALWPARLDGSDRRQEVGSNGYVRVTPDGTAHALINGQALYPVVAGAWLACWRGCDSKP